MAGTKKATFWYFGITIISYENVLKVLSGYVSAVYKPPPPSFLSLTPTYIHHSLPSSSPPHLLSVFPSRIPGQRLEPSPSVLLSICRPPPPADVYFFFLSLEVCGGVSWPVEGWPIPRESLHWHYALETIRGNNGMDEHQGGGGGKQWLTDRLHAYIPFSPL